MAKADVESEYLFSLLSSVINGIEPKEKPDDVDFERLFKLASFHTTANMAFYAVEKLENKPNDELMRVWSKRRDAAIMTDIRQMAELEVITAALADKKIRCMPLKGSVIKNLYPQSDMRAMSDIDILVDEGNAAAVRDIMSELGYEVKQFGEADDAYLKGSVYVEIHKSLFERYYEDFARVFDNPWRYAAAEDGFRYSMDNGYFFVYMLTHALKHYIHGGTGIRSFMDIYVFKKCFSEEYEEYAALAKKMLDEKSFRTCMDFVKLSEIWFGAAKDDGSLEEVKRIVITGGTYGSFSTGVENRVKEQGRFKYFFTQAFPPIRVMVYTFPVLKKAPFLLPFCWIARPFVKLFTNRQEMKAKIKAVMKR